MITDLMIQANPPEIKRGGRKRVDPSVRRDQLIQNPNTWFVWQNNAKSPAYVRVACSRLLGISQTEKFKMREAPYKFRCVRNNGNPFYTIYVCYSPKGNQ